MVSTDAPIAPGRPIVRYASLDDEPHAHTALRALLTAHPGFVDRGRYLSPAEALDGLAVRPVDLLFLDYELVGSTGFDVLDRMSRPPITLLLTAHADFALQAFERGVRDYLLKPLSAERLAIALDRVEPLLIRRGDGGGSSEAHRSLAFSCGRTHRLLAPERIVSIEAEGNFSWVVTDIQRVLISESMKSLEARLRIFGFVRVHKGHMVNLRHLRSVGASEVTLSDGRRLPIGKVYRQELARIPGLA